ncbi:MAG: hypothetical protein KAI43_12760 [Candidatus Aureabacteria bacterium]|nr:hypothetical protein [Candidatus Auribacterota bacterium]
MRRVFLIIFACIYLSGCGPKPEEKANELYVKAQLLESQDKPEEAKIIYKQIIDEYPQTTVAVKTSEQLALKNKIRNNIKEVFNFGETYQEPPISCRSNLGAIESACAIYYASCAAGGYTPTFPADYTDTNLYGSGDVPTCPEGGRYIYDLSKGEVNCSIHGKPL